MHISLDHYFMLSYGMTWKMQKLVMVQNKMKNIYLLSNQYTMKKILLSIAFVACAITSFASADYFNANDGKTYNWYRSSWQFYVTSWWIETNVIAFKTITTTWQVCGEPTITTSCKADENIRKQIAQIIADAEYSCIDTQELVSLSQQLNVYSHKSKNNCTPTTKTIEVQFMTKVKVITKVIKKVVVKTIQVMPNTGVNL